GEPRPGRVHAARPGGPRGDPRIGVRDLPAPPGAAPPARRVALGRRAADGGDRARAHDPAAAPDAGRALARPGSPGGGVDLHGVRRHQPDRRRGLPGGAERPGRVGAGPPGLPARARPDRGRGDLGGAPRRSRGPPGLPRPPGRLPVKILLQQLILGLLLGGLYGLAAAGLSLIFGVLKVLNVAHGELIMVGGYAAFWLATGLGLDPFVALLGVIPLMALLGLGLYAGLFGFVVRFD